MSEEARTPLDAQTAVRIAAAMVRDILDGLRPDRRFPPSDRDMICAIARTAGVHLPEIDEQIAAFEQLKAECLEEKARRVQVQHRRSAEESA